jgi:uncharacterized protein YqhQ
MAPSQLQVAISSLKRLLKEEASYYKEQEQQKTRIANLEKDKTDEDGNRDFTLKQEVRQSFATLFLYMFDVLCFILAFDPIPFLPCAFMYVCIPNILMG